ncbi:hypothetical protein BKA93DRAFT_771492 [Sparassis latifolia]|uniref:SUZ domain-containing protein n=1 Tax=Sparassis crispa TaxID=139825 RepID=A0A401GN32_9APHY|nr:predicted protein [Sparassis crispa]GBE83625.1 predicted protein [Sparassis crispa]
MGAPIPPRAQRRVASVQPTPEAWDDEDDEEEDQQALWENANNKAPMPELVISASSTTSVVSPPPAAIQPTLRILKRPTNSQLPSSSAPGSETMKSYAEREAEYQAARQRIFQESTLNGRSVNNAARVPSANSREGSSASSPSSGRDSSSASSVKIIRDPHGPSSLPGAGSQPRSPGSQQPRGFSARRNPKGSQSKAGSGDRAA